METDMSADMYMIVHPGCLTGPTESQFETALHRALKEPAGTEVVALYRQTSQAADTLERFDYLRKSRDGHADRADALYKALAELRDQVESYPLDDSTTCMCGSPIEGHNVGSGHAPVSQSDHAISLIIETIERALRWAALPMGTVKGDANLSTNAVGISEGNEPND